MQDRFLRAKDIFRDPNHPDATPLFPIGRTAFYAAVKRGAMPAPIKIGQSSLWSEKALLEAAAKLPGGSQHE